MTTRYITLSEAVAAIAGVTLAEAQKPALRFPVPLNGEADLDTYADAMTAAISDINWSGSNELTEMYSRIGPDAWWAWAKDHDAKLHWLPFPPDTMPWGQRHRMPWGQRHCLWLGWLSGQDAEQDDWECDFADTYQHRWMCWQYRADRLLNEHCNDGDTADEITQVLLADVAEAKRWLALQPGLESAKETVIKLVAEGLTPWGRPIDGEFNDLDQQMEIPARVLMNDFELYFALDHAPTDNPDDPMDYLEVQWTESFIDQVANKYELLRDYDPHLKRFPRYGHLRFDRSEFLEAANCTRNSEGAAVSLQPADREPPLNQDLIGKDGQKLIPLRKNATEWALLVATKTGQTDPETEKFAYEVFSRKFPGAAKAETFRRYFDDIRSGRVKG